MGDSFLHQEAKETLKSLLGFSPDDKDADIQIEFALNMTEELVRNYCNIEDIPAGLTSTIIKMSVDMFRNEAYGSERVPQMVKAVSMGDTKTEFGTVQSVKYEESLLKDYRKQLNRYRRVIF